MTAGTTDAKNAPPNVEKNIVKEHICLSYRAGKGSRIRLPSDPMNSSKPTLPQSLARSRNGLRQRRTPRVRLARLSVETVRIVKTLPALDLPVVKGQ